MIHLDDNKHRERQNTCKTRMYVKNWTLTKIQPNKRVSLCIHKFRAVLYIRTYDLWAYK